MTTRLLIVERDPRYGEWLRQHLGVEYPDAKVELLGPDEFEQVITTLSRRDFDLLLLSMPFGTSPEDPESEGLQWLRRMRNQQKAFPPLIAIADEGNELTAVRALQLGALDYLPKRLLTPARLRNAVRLALRRLERRRMKREAARAARRATRQAARRDASRLESTAALRGIIPGYTIRCKIGESEKAFVYLASSEKLGRDVALKVSKIQSDESNQQQFFAREYAAIAALRHPSIVEIYDYGVEGGHEYLAMEYFPLGDLKARIQRGLTEEESLKYLERIARALQVVHEAGLLHRDLKPPNVMLREGDEIVLIDFGLARNIHTGIGSTRTGVLRGSPYYMSPEQALGEELDPRTDLYSLGVIFYEMLTGQKPFTGSTAMEVLQQHVNAPVPRLPEHLLHHQELLGQLLAKDRTHRFETAAQVAEAAAGLRVTLAVSL